MDKIFLIIFIVIIRQNDVGMSMEIMIVHHDVIDPRNDEAVEVMNMSRGASSCMRRMGRIIMYEAHGAHHHV